jgi:hypothetical protein
MAANGITAGRLLSEDRVEVSQACSYAQTRVPMLRTRSIKEAI